LDYILDFVCLENYRKVNPAAAPILILALTSEIVGKPQMYDTASPIIQQKLSRLFCFHQAVNRLCAVNGHSA